MKKKYFLWVFVIVVIFFSSVVSVVLYDSAVRPQRLESAAASLYTPFPSLDATHTAVIDDYLSGYSANSADAATHVLERTEQLLTQAEAQQDVAASALAPPYAPELAPLHTALSQYLEVAREVTQSARDGLYLYQEYAKIMTEYEGIVAGAEGVSELIYTDPEAYIVHTKELEEKTKTAADSLASIPVSPEYVQVRDKLAEVIRAESVLLSNIASAVESKDTDAIKAEQEAYEQEVQQLQEAIFTQTETLNTVMQQRGQTLQEHAATVEQEYAVLQTTYSL
ncbi:MAG: hypothetical protein H6774_04600 [Pseudomonadales bacterium]|nr:hypothetical protein [Candidatus Woesebacteria bacterium]MCB9802338.1 hypothetical protein [Pseudomonadales bacterium]